MSRSRRHFPARGVGADSDQFDKRLANRRLRRAHRQQLDTIEDPELIILPVMREVSNEWSMNKDGKTYFGNLRQRDPVMYRQMMGK